MMWGRLRKLQREASVNQKNTPESISEAFGMLKRDLRQLGREVWVVMPPPRRLVWLCLWLSLLLAAMGVLGEEKPAGYWAAGIGIVVAVGMARILYLWPPEEP